jgi:glucosamine-6-phosphate deaminase
MEPRAANMEPRAAEGEHMKVEICESREMLARRAAADGAARIREALRLRGEASVVIASGTSQLEMLDHLVGAGEIDWHAVTGFHLDEYVGLPITHRASFRLYMWQRFVQRLPLPLAAFHYLDGGRDPEAERRRVGAIIEGHAIDVAFVGIGENGHIAFNEPPADFETEEPYLVVELTLASRRQQVGEGWFPSVSDVPRRAISMSVKQVMKAAAVVCCALDERKAAAVKAVVLGPVTPEVPASILQRHDRATLYLDPASASRLSEAA